MVEGTRILFYCEKCGKRVRDEAFVSSGARKISETKATCGDCAGGRRSSRAVTKLKESRGDARRPGTVNPQADAQAAAVAGPPMQVQTPAVRSFSRRHLLPAGLGVLATAAMLLVIFQLIGGSDDRTDSGEKADGTQVAAVEQGPSQQTSTGQGISIPAKVDIPATTEPATALPAGRPYNPREDAAASALNRARQFAAEKPDDPWGYRDLLQKLVEAHRGTTAGKEGEHLLAELKLPTPYPPEDMDVLDDVRWNRAIDLLAMMDPAQDAIKGKWERKDGGLVCNRINDGAIVMPYAPPEEYDMRIAFTRRDGNDAVGLRLIRDGKPFAYYVASYGNKVSGIDYIDGQEKGKNESCARRDAWLRNGQRYVLTVSVRRGTFRAYLDGERICQLDIKNNELSTSAARPPEEKKDWLGLIAWNSGTRFESAELVEVNGAGRRPERQSATVATGTPGAGEPSPAQAVPEAAVSPPAKPAAAYAAFVARLQAGLTEQGWERCRHCLKEAAGDAALKPYARQVKADEACVVLAERATAAVAQGAAKLKDGQSLTLKTRNGDTLAFGRGGDCQLARLNDGRMSIDQKVGSGMLGRDVLLDDLTPESKAALVGLGLPEGGEGKLAMALYRYATCGNPLSAAGEIGELLDAAEKATAPAEETARVREWLRMAQREVQAEGALTALEDQLERRDGKAAKESYQSFTTEYADTAAYVQYLENKSAGVEKKLYLLTAFVPGVLAHFHAGSSLNDLRGTRVRQTIGTEKNTSDVPEGIDWGKFSTRYEGFLNIDQEGEYVFWIDADDTAALFIGGKELAKVQCRNSGDIRLHLSRDYHALRIDYAQTGGGRHLRFRWKPPGTVDYEEIPSSVFCHHADPDAKPPAVAVIPTKTATSVYRVNRDGLIVIEAEHCHGNQPGESGKTWKLDTTVAGFSGEGQMAALPDTGLKVENFINRDAPRLDYNVALEKGDYWFWVRGHGPDPNGDSINIALDQKGMKTWGLEVAVSDGKWDWNRMKEPIAVEETRTYTLNVFMREDGTRIDKFILTRSGDFKPSDLGPFEEPNEGGNQPTTPDKPDAPIRTAAPVVPKGEIHFGFEDGSLQNWRVIEGRFERLLCDREKNYNNNNPFGKQGKFFLSTLDGMNNKPNDGFKGVIESPPFKLTDGKVSFLVAGGKEKQAYVALCTLDGRELVKAQGEESEAMQRIEWNAQRLVNVPLCIRIIDKSTRSWGHICFDDFKAKGEFLPTKLMVLTARESVYTCRFTDRDPGNGWALPGFDDTSWQSGQAGYGKGGTPGAHVRTNWTAKDIWVRRVVEIPDRRLGRVRLNMHHDDDAEVYINGIRAIEAKGAVTDYQLLDIDPAALKALKPGRNIIAVHCQQNEGGQYIDFGLVEE